MVFDRVISPGVVPAKAGTHTPCPIERARRMSPGPRLRPPGTTSIFSGACEV
ncbi:MAG: hypothetical protein OJF62_000694 [Pseudolabrys sp.]|nr:hypothetical protein [Pseudolabrys sp.]